SSASTAIGTPARAGDPTSSRSARRSPSEMRSMKSVAWLLWIALALSSPAGAGAETSVAVIVNQSSSVRDLSLRDLEKMLKVEKQYWDDGKKVYLVLQESGSAEKEIIREKL